MEEPQEVPLEPVETIDVEVDVQKMKDAYFADLMLACEFGYIAHEKGDSLLLAQQKLMARLSR